MKMEKNKENYTVYIHNFPNGKSYVGITGQLPENVGKMDGAINISLIFFRQFKSMVGITLSTLFSHLI